MKTSIFFNPLATRWAGIEDSVHQVLWAMTLLLGLAVGPPARAQVSQDIQAHAAATGEIARPMSGTINCSTTKIVGSLTPGVAAELRLEVVVDVKTPGAAFFAPKSPSFRRLTTPYLVSATAPGIQTLSIPIRYDGSPVEGGLYLIRGLGVCPF